MCNFKLPPCSCSMNTPNGSVCPLCHQGMAIPKSYYPDLARVIDRATGKLKSSPEAMELLTKTFPAQDGHFRVPDLADKYIKKDRS